MFILDQNREKSHPWWRDSVDLTVGWRGCFYALPFSLDDRVLCSARVLMLTFAYASIAVTTLPWAALLKQSIMTHDTSHKDRDYSVKCGDQIPFSVLTL